MKNTRFAFFSLLCCFLCTTVPFYVYAKDKHPKKPAPTKNAEPTPVPTDNKEFVGKNTNHRDAYKDKKTKEEYIDIKVTPPEKRGQAGFVWVEVYNRSNYTLEINFDLDFESESYMKDSTKVLFPDMTPDYSAKQDFQIPGNGKMATVTKVTVRNVQLFARDANGVTEVKIPIKIDVIKS